MLNIRYFTDFRNFDGDDYRQFRDQLRKYHIGSVTLTVHVDGPVLLRNPPLEVAAVAHQLPRASRPPPPTRRGFLRGAPPPRPSRPHRPPARGLAAPRHRRAGAPA